MSDPMMLIWDRYGWMGFLGYVMVREIWPFVSRKVWPEQVRKARDERDRLSKMEERQLMAEERQVSAIEIMGKAVQDMTVAITSNNERLSTLIAGHAVHTMEMTDAIMLMRERTGSQRVHAKGKMV